MSEGGAGGKEVGRISLKVVPNTDKFRADLERQLKSELAGFDVKIDVKPADLEKFRKEVAAETRNLPDAKVKVRADTDLFQKRMLADLAKAHKDTEPKIALDVDGERFRKAFESEVKALQKDAKAKIPVDLELAADQRAKIAAEIEALKKLGDNTIQLKLDPEADYKLRQRVAKIQVKPEISQTDFEKALADAELAAKAAHVKINVDIEDKGAQLHLDEIIARMKVEAKLAKIKINVDVDKHNIEGVLSNIGDGLAGLASGVGQKAGVALGALKDQTVLFAVAIVGFLAPALALVSGALLALPAIIAGVAVPIGALVIGFGGIKKAAEDAGLLGENKKGKSTLGAQLKILKDSLSGIFQTGFTPIFKQLGGLLPVIGDGLAPIAQGIVGIAQALTNVVTSSAGMAAIKNTFANIAKAMQVATPGIQKFAEGMLNLISGGSNSLPKFAALFTQMGTSFSDWITKITTPDKLSGKTLTSPLDRALSGFVDILKTAGPIISDLFSKAFDFLSDPKKVHQMEDFLNNFRHFMDGLFQMSAGIFQVITNVFNWLANVSQSLLGIGDTISNLFKGGVLNGIGDAVSAQLDAVVRGLSGVFSGFWDGVVSGASAAWDSIPGLATAVIDGWKLQLSTIWDGIASGASAAWTAIAGFADLTIQGWQAELSGIWDGIADAAAAAWNGITSVADTTVLAWKSELSSLWDGVAQGASEQWDKIAGAATTAMDQLVAAVQQGINQALSFVQALPGQIASVFSGAAGLLVQAGKDLIQGLANGILAAGQAAVAAAQNVASQVTSAVKGLLGINSPSKVFHSIGTDTMAGLGNGIDEQGQDVVDKARALAQQITDAMNQGLAISPDMMDNLKQTLSQLGLQSDQLRVQRDNTTDPTQRKGLSDQLKQIQAVKDQLGLQEDQIGYSQKYGDTLDQNQQLQQQLGKSLGDMVNIGKNFAMANVTQFENDLGISGNGAIPQLANIGLDWASSMFGNFMNGMFQGQGTTINVNNMDDALAAKQNLDNRQQLQWTRRVN